MRESLYFFNTKTILKYLIVILTILLGGIIFLLKSNKIERQSESQKKDNSIKIKQLIDIGDKFYDTNKWDSAFVYYNKAQLLCNPKTNCEDYVYIVSIMANMQTYYGDYISSETNLTKTLPYLRFVKTPRIVRNVYSYIAFNYYATYDYKNAILYHKKALELPGTPYKKSIILTDIVLVYFQEKKYQKAADLLEILASKKAVYKKEPNDSDKHYAYILNLLGFCYFNLGKSEALDLYLKSLKTSIKLKDDSRLVIVYEYLSIFYKKKNPKLALEYAKKSYQQALIGNSASTKANCLALLIKTSNGNNLRQYSSDYINIIDSIIISRKKAKNQFTNIKYNFNKDKEENLQLKAQKAENELQLEKQKSRNIILSITILFVLGFMAFLYLYLTSKGKKEKKEAIYKSEIQISKKLHDELANDIYQTLSFVKNTDLELDENKDQLLKNLDAIYSRTRDISKENSEIATDEKYVIALKEMISGFKSSNINILLNGTETILWNEIEKSKKITVYRVLQELLVNMRKHSEATLVGINFKTTEKSIVVNYTDNGKGIDTSEMNLKNGLHNVENRISAIKGEIVIESSPGKGFKVFIKFPV
ncbi:tetratricopeptide repeat-containing sensor histidine kinase [Flavobacterium sp. JAS]|uniref:tetratricopeptide repeat-containing sensor histidine kinase n=1 Tax=Flavobacterium sp. JAS TaxID=2897329 RepID=UPI001E2833E7|nr:tetratricopeptide repeat-containing sensor histidine kinase [Flavobacterium sp. JAS]MCD0472199.1 ATP-binding protein [Flavobacterium sp. JAS]